VQTAQNQTTLGANELLIINVVVPTAQETQNLANTGIGTGFPGLQPISNPAPTNPLTGQCPGCGRDDKVKKDEAAAAAPGRGTCGPNQTPPCEPSDLGGTRQSSARPPVCVSEPCN
jgi:hypothetical protein